MWLLNNPCYHDNLTDAGKFFWLMLLCTMADQIKHWLFWNCLDSFLELNSPKLTWVLKSLYFEVLPMMMILPTVLSGQKFSSGGDLRNCSSENFKNSQENSYGKVLFWCSCKL